MPVTIFLIAISVAENEWPANGFPWFSLAIVAVAAWECDREWKAWRKKRQRRRRLASAQ